MDDQMTVADNYDLRTGLEFRVFCYEHNSDTADTFTTYAAADLAAGIEELIHQFYNTCLADIMTTNEVKRVIKEAVTDIHNRTVAGTLLTPDRYYSRIR